MCVECVGADSILLETFVTNRTRRFIANMARLLSFTLEILLVFVLVTTGAFASECSSLVFGDRCFDCTLHVHGGGTLDPNRGKHCQYCIADQTCHNPVSSSTCTGKMVPYNSCPRQNPINQGINLCFTGVKKMTCAQTGVLSGSYCNCVSMTSGVRASVKRFVVFYDVCFLFSSNTYMHSSRLSLLFITVL
jgi:hypothetical protein